MTPKVDHYEWIGAMYCENDMVASGDFDTVKEAGECPSCGVAL